MHAPADLPALAAATDVTAYRIALEALTNAARHAHARHCTLRISLGGAEALEVEVRDDGIGLGSSVPGVGLTAMRERARELGGHCVVSSAATGGTCVLASIPLAAGP